MSEKTTATAAPEKTSSRGQGTKENGELSSRLVAENPFFGLQQSIGNQAMLRLLDDGVIQTKLRVSQPGDADEQEADRIAEQVVSLRTAPTIQRKCACSGGTPCSKCAGEEEETIHRSVTLPKLRYEEGAIQRAPAEGASPGRGHHHGTHPLVVEDDATNIEPHQMHKSRFIALLRTDACATADAVLMSVGRTTKGCPYIAKWLSFYEKQSSHHVESAMQKYAPETARARSAHEAIRLLTVRIQKAATSWAKTGKVEGLPPEVASQISAGKGLLEKAHDFATTGVAGAIFGFIGGAGKKTEDAASGSVMRKARGEAGPVHDVTSVRSQLGTGHSLDSRVQSQMSSAFGYDFSGVRVHTDSSAATLSSNLQARAFTIGSDVAFASNEYQPGTLVGDALIAHELAHVVQQSGSAALTAPMKKADHESNALETDADEAAAAAVLSSWTGKQNTNLSKFGGTATTQLRSGLRLQRCNDSSSKTSGTTAPPTGSGSAAPPPPAHPSADGSKATTAFGEFEAVKYHALVEKASGKEVGVEMFLRFNPGPKVDAKQIALTQAASGKLGGTSAAAADPNFGRRSATTGPGKGEFIDVLTGFPSPAYAAASTPTGGADPAKLTSYPSVPSRDLTAAESTTQEASSGVTGQTRTGFGKYGFRYMEGGHLKGPEPAELYDSPQLGTANDSEQIFESTALAIEGTQERTYYGSVNWGWKRNGAGAFSMVPFKAISQGTPSAGFLTAATIFSTATEDFNWGVNAPTVNLLDPTDLTKTIATLTRGTALDWGGAHALAGGIEFRAVTVKDGASRGSAGVIRAADMARMDVGRPTVHLPVPEVYTTNAASAPLVANPAKEGSTLIKNLPKDTRVTVVDDKTNPNWFKIKIVDGPDTDAQGWVKKTVLTREALGTHT